MLSLSEFWTGNGFETMSGILHSEPFVRRTNQPSAGLERDQASESDLSTTAV